MQIPRDVLFRKGKAVKKSGISSTPRWVVICHPGGMTSRVPFHSWERVLVFMVAEYLCAQREGDLLILATTTPEHATERWGTA